MGSAARRCRGSTRKRTLACIGLGLVAATPLLSSVALMVQASPFIQHPVRAARRQVSYRHLAEGIPRDLSSKFWVKGLQEVDEKKHNRARHLAEVLDDDPDHVVWSIIADASRQHPFGPGATASKEETGSQGHGVRRGSSHRRDQVTDKFVEDSTSAVLHEEGEGGNGGANTNSDEPGELPANLHANYAGFNVTAQVVYNVSTPEDENDSSTVGGGSASSILTSSSKLPDNSSSTFNSTHQPLRLRAVISEQRDGGEYLTARGRRVLLNDIIRPALLTWSAALRVEPVAGNLTVDKHQLFDNQTCGPGMDSGLPSPKVPSYHLTEGIPDTDMILYLSIGFAPGAFKNWTRFIRNPDDPVAPQSSNNSKANNGRVTSNPRRQDDRELGWNRQEENGLRTAATATPTLGATYVGEDDDTAETGMPMPTADPQAETPQPLLCGGDYIAAASFCSTDQYDRPTAAMLHLCIGPDFFSNATRDMQIVTIMHEVGHALGFNARSMAHFRRPDGSPITPRVDGEIVETTVECTGPSSNRLLANVALPSEEILQFRTVRGGVRVAQVVTPSVLQVARNHFDCQNLTGAELESGEYSPLSGDPDEEACIGDHWERRLFQNDLMNPVIDGIEYSPFISTITLAYFADSGWYQVDLSMAELAASWGRGAGCGFVEDTCIGQDGTVPPSNKPFFCNATPTVTATGLLVHEIDGCTADLYSKATCSLGQHAMELPPEYQYFGSDNGKVGGDDAFIDYCPTYTGFENGLCSSTENAAVVKVNNIERFGKRNSRCLSGVMQTRTTALCLPIACVVEDRSLHVKVDGIWRLCEHKEQELKVLDDQYVVCPDPRRVCPTFYCHHDCLGTSGRCDYDTGACVCSNINATNTTLGTLGNNSTNATGVCRREQGLNSFALGGRNRTLIEMPHADSPLSDYYVPFKESLRDDQMRLLTTLQLIILVFFLAIIAGALFWYYRLRGASKGDEAGDGNDEDDAPSTAANANKDKMIATVLVDIRMNAPDAASVAPTADMESSLCDMESRASGDSSLCASSLDHPSLEHDDRSSLASEEVLDDADALGTKPECSVRKRRFKGHFIRQFGSN